MIGDITVITSLEELLSVAALADVAQGINHGEDGAFARDDFIGVEDSAGGGEGEGTKVLVGDPDVDSKLQVPFFTHGVSAMDQPRVWGAVFEDIAPEEGFEPLGLHGETAAVELGKDCVALPAGQGVEVDEKSDKTTRADCFHFTRLRVKRPHVMVNMK